MMSFDVVRDEETYLSTFSMKDALHTAHELDRLQPGMVVEVFVSNPDIPGDIPALIFNNY